MCALVGDLDPLHHVEVKREPLQVDPSAQIGATMIKPILYTPFGARAKSSRWERSRLQVYVVLARGGVDEHRHVVADAVNQSEWSAKCSQSEHEANHERRSVDWVRRDRGVCDVLMLDGVDEHRHVVTDALDRSELSAKRLRSIL